MTEEAYYNSSFEGNFSAIGWLESCDVQVQKIDAFVRLNLRPWLLPLQITLCVLSCLSSCVTMYVFTRPAMLVASLSLFLAVLEAANMMTSLIFLSNCVVLLSFPHLFTYRTYAYLRIVLLCIAWSAMSFTLWMTVIVGIWRFVSVEWPLKAKLLLSRTRAVAIILCFSFVCLVTTFSLIIYLADFDYPTTLLCDSEHFDQRVPYLHNYSRMLKRYCALGCIGFLFIPTVCSVLVNLCLVWSLRRAFRRRNALVKSASDVRETSNKSTAILIVMLVSFLVSHASPCFANMASATNWYLQLSFSWRYAIQEFLLGLLVNTLSVLGYYHMSTNFRTTIWKTIERVSVRSTATTIST